MNSIHLPFSAIRVFEQFSRRGSVSAAAEVLNISQSAVLHQLRALNDLSGQALVRRQGRNLILTQQGRDYYEAISPAMTVLRQATEHLQEGTLEPRILVSALPLITHAWLLPELAEFGRRMRNFPIQLQYARYRNYSSDAADISLRFGTGEWPGYSSTYLLSGDAAPVASRGFAETHGLLDAPDDATLADWLTSLPLIHDGPPEIWDRWFDLAGVPITSPPGGLICEDGLMTRTATLLGQGVSLARIEVVRRDLVSGDLVQLSPLKFRDGQDYYLCTRDGQTPHRRARDLVLFLKQQARNTRSIAPNG